MNDRIQNISKDHSVEFLDDFLQSLSSWSGCQELLASFLENNSGWKLFNDAAGVYLLVTKEWSLRPRKKFPLYVRSRRRMVGDELLLHKAGVIINIAKDNRITGKILDAEMLKRFLDEIIQN